MTDLTAIDLTALDDATLGAWALEHLKSVVAIDSASDERSDTVPSTEGQAHLADYLAGFFAELGAEVERDDFANIIATFPGRGPGASQPPVALMVHLDTARGTAALTDLNVLSSWGGDRIPYPENDRLQVDVETYPDLTAFVGQDLVYGTGKAPFGLDDKLGLTHMMTLARVLHAHSDLPHPPLLLIGRPDEEIGREEALLGLAKSLAERGVHTGFTIDGLLPYEINVENFNAAHCGLVFQKTPVAAGPWQVEVQVLGVNTHGATAKSEGHRPATRLTTEIMGALGDLRGDITPVSFECDPLRDCDATVRFRLSATTETAARTHFDALKGAVERVVQPHVCRGAGYVVGTLEAASGEAEGGIDAALQFIERFLASDGMHPISAEDSDNRQGYTQPYRIETQETGIRVDLRIRDFTPEGLEARKDHIRGQVPEGAVATFTDQYVNMAPRMAHRPELVAWPKAAAEIARVDVLERPIRGGTGVDPFLDQGTLVANLGTGYFAPESEKEFTSVQLMAGHARWLVALMGVLSAA
ncbi:MAG: hypothetical protein ACE366_01405 [Bradymonadia bacterium]